jgi:hypothetical protein
MGHEAIHGPLLAALALRVRGRELHAGAVQQLGKPKLLLSQSRFGGVKLPGLAFNSLPSFQLWPEQVAFDGSNVGGKKVELFFVYSPDINLGVFAPPQVRGLAPTYPLAPRLLTI